MEFPELSLDGGHVGKPDDLSVTPRPHLQNADSSARRGVAGCK